MDWLRQLFSRRRRYDELSESIREHLDEKIADLMDRGMTQEEAERSARREFGNVTRIEERSREVWQWPTLESLWADAKFACRQLRRTPGFTLIALLIMACGIGAGTGVFSVIDSVLLRPYAFRDPGQIVVWREVIQEVVKQYPSVPDNYRHFLYLKSHAKTIQDAALLQNASFAVTAGGGDPRVEKGLYVSPNFLSVLGVSPILGRTFRPEETQLGRNDVVLISWAAWQDLFHGDPDVVGRMVTIKGQPTMVIGVLPRSFEFPVINEMGGGASPDQTSSYELFQPFTPQGDDLTSDDADFAFLVIARLRADTTVREASAELTGMLSAYAASNHLPMHLSVIVDPLSEEASGSIRKALWLLFSAVLGLLLIACVNLAGLQLARSMARERDNAVRTALGAGRTRLFQAALMESAVLCLIGGVSGVLLAIVGIRLFILIAPENLPRLNTIHVTWSVLLFACGVSGATALLSGMVPALRSLRSDPQRALQSSSTRILRAGHTYFFRKVLISFELACTVVLLIVTGLMLRSFSRVLYQQRDFDASQVVVTEVDLLNPRYEQSANSNYSSRSQFIDRVLHSLRSTPGVEFAAITSAMPLGGDSSVHSIYRPDHPLPESEVPLANLRNISPGYFATVQTRLIAGSDFTSSERSNPHSAIISQRAAKIAWPNIQALGRQLKFDGQLYTVTGIASDARITNLKENVPVVYLPFWHDPPSSVFFLVRTSRNLKEFTPIVRHQVWDVDPQAAIPVITTFDTQVAQSVAPERLQSIILSFFSIAALTLAILGVYGVLAYSVSLRTPEFAVRVALGSSKVALSRLVLLEILIPVGIGITLGLLMSFAATRAIRSLLYETSSTDPLSITVGLIFLFGATLAAAFLPAYRASRIDPMRILRVE